MTLRMGLSGQHHRRVIVALCALALLCAAPARARTREKTDVIIMSNGDVITGEIKRLRLGILQISTSYLGTIYIEWEEVAQVTTPFDYYFETEDGTKYNGALTVPGTAGDVRIGEGASAADLPILDVVVMEPLGRTFWRSIDGHLSLGLNYADSSEISTFNFDGTVSYRKPGYLMELSLNSVVTDEVDETTSRQELSYHFQRFRKRKQFTDWIIALESNDELNIDLRLLLTATYGIDLIKSNHSKLEIGAGLAANEERLDNTEESETSLEAVTKLSYRQFRFKYPEVDFAADLAVYPSLTTSDRIRVELDSSLSRELVSDFFITLSLYGSYDSEVPDVDLSEPGAESSASDYGGNLGFTYKF